LWGNQFDSNYERTISYLLTSKAKFQEDILKKELAQKEKARLKKRQSAIFAAGAIIVIIVSLGAAFYGTNEQKKAYKALEVAKIAEGKALKQKDNAKVAADSAMAASKRATREQKLAEISANAAIAATKRANESKKEAENNLEKTKEAQAETERSQRDLKITVANLRETQIAEKDATKKADNATKYQEILNTISSLRIKIQNKDYDTDSLDAILNEVEKAYLDYNKATLDEKKINIPNNNMYQVLMAIRKELMDNRTLLNGIEEDLKSLANGIRKISISPGGTIAAGGDDGILLYSKKPFNPVNDSLYEIRFGRDRIRSLEFISNNQLLIGTVQGKLLQFNTSTSTSKVVEVGILLNQIVEQILVTPKGVFVLAGGQVRKVPVSELTKTAAGSKELPKAAAIPKELPKAPGIPKELPKTAGASMNMTKSELAPDLIAKSIFKFSDEKLLVVRDKDNTLVLLDMATLKWQPVVFDLKKAVITAAVSSGGKLFLGLDNGNIALCNIIQRATSITITTEGTILAHRTRITGLTYDEPSKKLFSASLDQTAKIFDLKLEKLGVKEIERSPYSLEGFDKWIWDFGLIQTGKVKTLLTVDESGKLKSWQTDAETLYNEIYSSIKK
jgi:WD40 repeat protein